MTTWNTPAWRAGDWRGWLQDHGSLTRRLQSICPHLRVQRLSQHVIPPLPDEYRQLGLRRGQRALVREVLLICGDIPLVFAHSVIPLGEAPRRLWMRRSQFALAGQPLLVTEVFLPAVLGYRSPDSRSWR